MRHARCDSEARAAVPQLLVGIRVPNNTISTLITYSEQYILKRTKKPQKSQW